MTTADEFAAPGSVLEVRDETWLVLRTERATDGWFVEVQGLSELVRGTQAMFSTALDTIRPVDPAQATVRVDTSAGFKESRLWLEATLRKTAVPMTDPRLTVATRGLLDVLPYQVAAVRQALDPDNLRPRILLADAVGLGKTLEIGMILSELVRRGRGDRILVVTPRHVLEQMQFELWTRFALPFVRLDSVGVQRVRQKIPASRNPFTYFKRAIVSIDTLKSNQHLARLEKVHWDAVVIDESHNVTNDSTQNNRLARLLSRQSEALILASATPHNGKAASFAELIRMLEPSAVTPDGDIVESEVKRLVIRRHRHSADVASFVGKMWAERQEPHNLLVPANAVEDEIARELEHTWMHPAAGASPYSGKSNQLFPWTLAKAFLSSPAALGSTVQERRKRIDPATPGGAREDAALSVLADLVERNLAEGSAKYDRLVEHLREIGVGPTSEARVVIFAERVSTLHWLEQRLRDTFGLKAEQVRVLHGGVSDEEQQELVASFKLESSPVRVLVTGDVASEGVNLHQQCHELVHYDIPWSLIRIEQRNGRIDRYGQEHAPRITTLLLDPSTEKFGGDLRVLHRLVEKEHEAHKTLGDSASLIGTYDVKAEEDAIREVLAGRKKLDDVVRSVEEVQAGGGVEGMLSRLLAMGASAAEETEPVVEVAQVETDGVYGDDLSFLRDALVLAFETPAASVAVGGVEWREHTSHAVVQLVPSADLRQRLEVLPQTYLKERDVRDTIKLATSIERGKQALVDARGKESISAWPETHYLAPLHPCLDWAADRALESLRRNEVFAVAGQGDEVAMLLQGTLTNQRGQVVAAMYVVVRFPDPDNPHVAVPQPVSTLAEAFEVMGYAPGGANTGQLAADTDLDAYVAPGVEAARAVVSGAMEAVAAGVADRVERWSERATEWQRAADETAQRLEIKQRRVRVEEEQQLVSSMRPDQRTVRPLLLVVPTDLDGGGS